MLRADVLKEAIKATKARSTSYGTPENNFERIAALWNAHLGNRVEPAAPLNAIDVTLMCGLIKVARLENDPTHMDSWVDIAGYGACGGEIASREEEAVDAEPYATAILEKAFRQPGTEPVLKWKNPVVVERWGFSVNQAVKVNEKAHSSLSGSIGKVVGFTDEYVVVDSESSPDLQYWQPHFLTCLTNTTPPWAAKANLPG